MNVMKLLLVILISALKTTTAHAKSDTWIFTTLEWPPFMCSRCPENGAAAKALRETLRKSGIRVEFSFQSWTKAVKNGSLKENVGFFPAWHEEVREGFVSSSALFFSPVGFVEPRSKPLIWNHLSDLKGKVIGISQDYGYPKEFNQLVAAGVIKVEVVESDDTNLRKVALGRVDGALLDINNARYFLSMSLKNLGGRVSVNNKVVENKSLHAAFNSYSHDKVAILEGALRQTNFQKIVDDYLKKYTRL
ncbi:Bacterial extracellular solute-binding protein, family 3 [compost metagenome]